MTVKEIYDFATYHRLLDYDINIVLDIINSKREDVYNSCESRFKVNKEGLPFSTINNTSTISGIGFKEYSIQDLIDLLT